MSAATGGLTLVATPIGNLGDLAPRAIEALRTADVIACEDSRRTGLLLHHFSIPHGRMVVVNDHTEAAEAPALIERMLTGAKVALVSDAGTPGISDPGERLVASALDAGLAVSAVPGPAALVMALVLSGLPTRRFVFEGFIPRSGGERTDRIAELVSERRTVVLYEAPHRIERTITDLAAACGGSRRVALARELTKLHEDVWRGALADAVEHTRHLQSVGEYVIVLEGAAPPGAAGLEQIRAAVAERLAAGASTKVAAGEVAAALRVPKRLAYDLALQLGRESRPSSGVSRQ